MTIVLTLVTIVTIMSNKNYIIFHNTHIILYVHSKIEIENKEQFQHLLDQQKSEEKYTSYGRRTCYIKHFNIKFYHNNIIIIYNSA